MNRSLTERGHPEIRVGILLTGERMTPQEMATWARRAEVAGAESVWVSEGFWDALVPLALIAAATRTSRIGTACAITKRHPHLAQMALAGLDEVSNGRLVVGLSSGPSGPIGKWYGPKPTKPITHMREYIQMLRLMLAAQPGEAIDFNGTYFELEGFRRSRSLTRGSIPMLIGATGSRMIRLAGEIGDGFIASALNSVQFFDDIVLPNIDAGLAGARGSRESFEVAAIRICSLHADPTEARRRAQLQIAFYIGIAPALAEVLDFHGFSRQRRHVEEAFKEGKINDAAAAIPAEAVKLLSICGGVEDCRHQLQDFAGRVDSVILYPVSFALSAEEVEESHGELVRAISSLSRVTPGANVPSRASG